MMREGVKNTGMCQLLHLVGAQNSKSFAWGEG